MRSLILAVAFCLPILAAAPPRAAAQDAAMAERIANDPRVTAHRPYGLPIPPSAREDKSVQFGKFMRFKLQGSTDFGRIGIVTPTLKPVKKGDRIVIAFWARASGTDAGLPGKIGRVQLEATPVIRTIFEKAFDIGPEWKMYQLSGRSDQDYKPGALNAALHIDAAKQTLDVGPIFVLNYGQTP